jgi:hypothetical protein
MAEQQTKRYMELQMEELKETYGVSEEEKAPVAKKSTSGDKKDAEIAGLYEDLAEYEEDLKSFEDELTIVKRNEVSDISTALSEEMLESDRDYENELQSIMVAAWTHKVEVEQSHPQAELELIKSTRFNELVMGFNDAFPEYLGSFEDDVKSTLVTRLETLIAIKKDHIKEEVAEIKTAGLKPSYAKRIYKRYHGID